MRREADVAFFVEVLVFWRLVCFFVMLSARSEWDRRVLYVLDNKFLKVYFLLRDVLVLLSGCDGLVAR